MAKYKGIIISDIHVGAMNLEKLYHEYTELFIKFIYNMDKLDFVIVDGDFFDHKFYLNDKESIIAYQMLKDLVLACKEKDSVLRFVYGTESHECNQYDILSLLKIYDKVEVIKTVKEEELLKDLHILYLPEEYLINKSEYYEDYFIHKKRYDYVFGHGVIREVMKDAAVQIENKSKDSKRKKPPVFTSAELLNICKGQIYFGHYHINQEYCDDVISVGSFSRWKFGEEGRKGFYIVECDTEKEKYTNKYIENTLADTYHTVTFGYNNKIFKDESTLQKSILALNRNVDNDNHIRYVFNIPSDIDNPEASINIIKENYKNQENVKIEIVNGYVADKKEQQKEALKHENEKYGFIFDKNLSIEDILSRFISIEYDREIPSADISKYLYSPLKELF